MPAEDGGQFVEFELIVTCTAPEGGICADHGTVPSGVTIASSPNTNTWTNNTYSVTLTVAGTYDFKCDYHFWMNGTIIVTGSATTTTGSGQTTSSSTTSSSSTTTTTSSSSSTTATTSSSSSSCPYH